jgi:hypothetical protein
MLSNEVAQRNEQKQLQILVWIKEIYAVAHSHHLQICFES